MSEFLKALIVSISTHHGINDKSKLTHLIADKFSLPQDRAVYYCADFPIRFSSSKHKSFSNPVISL